MSRKCNFKINRQWFHNFQLLMRFFMLGFAIFFQHVANANAQMQPCRIAGYAFEIQCLEVKKSSSMQIAMTIYKIPARVRYPAKTPIIWIPDGLGISTNERAPIIIHALSRLRNEYDVVWIDFHELPSDATHCNFNQLNSVQQRFYRLEDEQQIIECIQNFQKQHPYVSELYRNIAKHYEQARKLLSVKQVLLLTEGRGSEVATSWHTLNAQAIKFQVLDSPQLKDSAEKAQNIDAQLNQLFKLCHTDPACEQALPNLKKQFVQLVRTLPITTHIQDPIHQQKTTFTITPNAFYNSLLNILRSPAKSKYLPLALTHASNHDWSIWVGLNAVHWSKRESKFHWGPHLIEQCVNFQQHRNDAPTLTELATWFYQTERKKLNRTCNAVKPTNMTAPDITTPTLLLMGNMSPTLEPKHPNLQNKVMVTSEHAGHGMLTVGCTKDIVYRYFKTMENHQVPTVESLQTGCLSKIPYPLIKTTSN